MFCRNCGKPSEAPLCPECAAAEQTPVTQPGVAPETAPAEAPAAAPAEEYMVMNLGEEQNAEENAPAKKKKSKKGLWISLIAVVAVLSLLLGLFWNTIMGWLRYQTSDPEEWYQEVEMESAKAATGGIAKLYGMLIKGDGLPLGDFNTADTKVELQLNQSLLDAVTALVPNQDQLPVDLNKLQNLSVSTKFTATEDMLHLTASLSGELDLHIYADLPNSKVYLQLPQAQEQALVIDTKAMFNLDLSGGLEDLLNTYVYGTYNANTYALDDEYNDYGTTGAIAPASRSGVLDMITNVLNNQAFKDAMPSEEEFQGMLDRITGAAITALSKNAQKDRREVTAGNSSETQNVLTTVIDEATARQALKAVLTTAKDDATVKKILDAVSTYLGETGMEMDLHSMVSMALPALIAELDQPANIPGSITLETYLNDEDEVVGRSVTVSGFDAESVRLSYNVVSGEAFIVQVPELTITGTIEEQDGVTTVTFDLPVDANNTFKVMIKCSDTLFAVRMTPPAELTKELIEELADMDGIPEMLLNELAVEIGVESTGSNNAKLWVSALAGETPMVTLSLSETLSKETPTLPSSATDVTDLRSIVSWVMSVDRPSLVQALTNLGLKEEFADDLISEIVYDATYNLV